MKTNFDDISKTTIIDYIYQLIDSMDKFKIEISISNGKIMNIIEDRVSIQGVGYYSNQSIKSLKKEDLIIILRYLQNINQCKNIIIENARYGEIYDVKRGICEKVPCNVKEVKNKIKEFLARKKCIAIIDRRK